MTVKSSQFYLYGLESQITINLKGLYNLYSRLWIICMKGSVFFMFSSYTNLVSLFLSFVALTFAKWLFSKEEMKEQSQRAKIKLTSIEWSSNWIAVVHCGTVNDLYFDWHQVINCVCMCPEMWYGVFLWAAVSSLVFHLPAALLSLVTLRQHKMARFMPIAILLMGIVGPVCGGVLTSKYSLSLSLCVRVHACTRMLMSA